MFFIYFSIPYCSVLPYNSLLFFDIVNEVSSKSSFYFFYPSSLTKFLISVLFLRVFTILYLKILYFVIWCPFPLILYSLTLYNIQSIWGRVYFSYEGVYVPSEVVSSLPNWSHVNVPSDFTFTTEVTGYRTSTYSPYPVSSCPSTTLRMR